MSTNNGNPGKIPRIELTRERSSTLESIQSLTRAIRESFRLHSVRREKKKRAKRQNKQDGLLEVGDNRRARSKSMDEQGYNENIDSYNEISDIGISGVVVSDFGPRIDLIDKPDDVFEETDETGSNIVKSENPELGQVKIYSKSLGENLGDNHRIVKKPLFVEGQQVSVKPKTNQTQRQPNHQSPKQPSPPSSQSQHQQHLSLDVVEENKNIPQRQQSMPADNSIRRHSRDDSDVNKVEASVLRKRFARLIDTLRAHKFSISSSVEDGAEQQPASKAE